MKRLDFANVFAIDLRSLALFRIALGATLFLEIVLQCRDLVAHFSDAGVFPSEIVAGIAGRSVQLSLHYWASSSLVAEGMLFAIAAVIALALMLGYQTRLATILSWVLLLSVQARNPWIFTAGYDKLLRLFLFWSIFLPLGARYSLDARRDSSAPKVSNRYVDVPGAALLLQVAFVYWVTGLRKTGITWTGGSAVFYALHLDLYVTHAGIWLREWTDLLRFGTHATRWLELLGPFFAFLPWRTEFFRGVAIVSFLGFHLTLALFLDIGIFPLVAMIGWLPFLPPRFWTALPSVSRLATRAEEGRPPSFRTPRLQRVACAVALAYVVVFLGLHNFGAALGGPSAIPGPVLTVGRVLGINQYWTMFSPDVASEEHWLVFEATLADGAKIDVLSGRAAQFGPPDPPLSSGLGLRWRIWIDNLVRRSDSAPDPPALFAANSAYLCAMWNEENGAQRQAREIRTILVSERVGGPPPTHRGVNVTSCP